MVLLARKDEEGNTQALYDHLHGAGRLASGFEDEFADISRTAAVLHDVGKVAQQFQTYLLSDDGHRGDVQHARQGAFVVNDFFESKGEIEEIAKEILELAISKHHGGLPDCIDESGNRAFLLGFTESDKSNEKYAYQEIKRGLNGLALDLQSNFRGSAEDIACFLKKIKSLRLSKDSIYFYLGLLVKLIYSRLVDADRTDAACFETRKQYRPNAVDWQNLISRLDKSMRSFDSSSEINRIRHQINEQCCLAGARETGIYRLSIPTGGGKTLASLNFGQVFAFKKAKDTDEVSIGVRGPVSIQPAFSINPIAIDDVQITKSVNSETTDSGKKSSDTMGMKYRVSGRAVYVTYGSISPQLAERTGFSAEDAEKIKEALVTLFENDESSARPSGSMEVLDVVWFAHNCKGGQYSSAKVHRSVSVDADGTVNVDDASIPGLRYEVIEGR